MKKVILSVALFVASSSVYANTAVKQDSVFKCVEKSTLEIKSECVQNVMANNIKFKQLEQKIAQTPLTQNGNQFATMKMYPELKLIRIIAEPQQAKPIELAKAF